MLPSSDAQSYLDRRAAELAHELRWSGKSQDPENYRCPLDGGTLTYSYTCGDFDDECECDSLWFCGTCPYGFAFPCAAHGGSDARDAEGRLVTDAETRSTRDRYEAGVHAQNSGWVYDDHPDYVEPVVEGR